MSMISSLIDELNKCADEWNGSNMFELARMCHSAADTITELRGALQVASVDYRHLSEENAKLQASNEVIAEDHAALCEHNAKLREYARKLLTGYECGRGELCEGCSWNGWDGDCNARMKARELGVEVDG